MYGAGGGAARQARRSIADDAAGRSRYQRRIHLHVFDFGRLRENINVDIRLETLAFRPAKALT